MKAGFPCFRAAQALLLVRLLCPMVPVSAVAMAVPMPAVAEGASHTQRFRYDLESSFAILALPGVPTDLQLAPDEHVTGFALGDTLQWVVEELPGHVFVKPLKPDLFTAGTLVTDRRTYQLTLRSGRPRDDWMQRVSWSYPELVILRGPAGVLPHDAERVPSAGGAATGQNRPVGPVASVARAALAAGRERDEILRGDAPRSDPSRIDPARLDFDYQVFGEAGFRPQMVFDDGLSTWLRIPPHETLPAIFAETADGIQLVNYAVQGEWVVLPRVHPALILKLGKLEVRVLRRARAQDTARPALPPDNEP